MANQGVEIVEGVGVAGIGACGPPCTKYINFDGSDYSLIDADNNPFEDDFDLTIEIETAGTAGDYLVTAIIEWTDSAGTHNVTDGGAVIAKRIIHNN
ncbi:hypothetical protein KKF73_02845 [Patescibacteria group bacterium]|nr:hypothetical protein [Patescibacteria group bacterium]